MYQDILKVNNKDTEAISINTLSVSHQLPDFWET